VPRRGAETLCFARIETSLRRRRLSHHLTQRPSHRRRGCPQPGDKRQDFWEHLSRRRDLGYLEGNVAAMAPFDIAELVEHEQRVITSAAEMPVVGAAFLLAVGRTLVDR